MSNLIRKRFFILLIFISLVSLVQSQQTVGLFINTEESLNGYTLFAPSTGKTTYLIDNCGYVVNSWESNYLPAISAYLLEDGSLLRTSAIRNDSVHGGVERYNWDGNLIWNINFTYEEYQTHHDIEYLPNGNILMLATDFKSEQEAIEMGIDPSIIAGKTMWTEIIIEVEPTGSSGGIIVWEWHAWDHLVQDFDDSKPNHGSVFDQPELININYISDEANHGVVIDWIHANSIDYNEEFDQIVISSRNFSEIWVIDHSTTTAEASGHTGGQYGKGGDILYRWGNPQCYDRGSPEDQVFFNQHDAHWIPENHPDAGKIMVYNNNNIDDQGELFSSVDIIAPPITNDGHYEITSTLPFAPEEVYWSYIASPPDSFHSRKISGAQRLLNGNTLICEGNKGHFFEIDYDGNLVWEYINPVEWGVPIEQGEDPSENSVFRTYRYAPDYPAFDDKLLIPGDPIELNPIPYECIIYETVDMEEVFENDLDIKMYPNPFNDRMNILNTKKANVTVVVYDITGRILYEDIIMSNAHTEIATSDWYNGIYIIRLSDENHKQLGEYKLIKH